MSDSFRTIEQLNIDSLIAEEIFQRQSEQKSKYKSSIELYNEKNGSWTIGFSEEIYRVCIKYFKTEKDYKTALKYLREGVKIFEFQYDVFRHFFHQNNSIHQSSTKKFSKLKHLYNFSYWMIDSNNVNKLIIKLVRNDDLLKPIKYTRWDGKESQRMNDNLSNLCNMIRYWELDSLKCNKNDFLKLIKDNPQIFPSKKRFNETVNRISSSDLVEVDYIQILNIVLEKFFLEEKTFINEPYIHSFHKHLFEISHRLRSEVFHDIENLNYSKYVNNEKLKLLINIKEIDYKSLYRKLNQLKKLKKEDQIAYNEQLSSLINSHLKSEEGIYLYFVKENTDYSYYKMLFADTREKSMRHFENIQKTQSEYFSFTQKNKPFPKEEMNLMNYNMTMNMANTYQYVGLTHPDLEEGLKYVKRSIGIFAKIRSSKSGPSSMYGNYLQSLIWLKNSKNAEEFVEKVKSIKEEYLDPKNDKEKMRFDMLPPVAKHIYNVIRISSLITRTDSDSLEFLFNRMQSSNTSDSFVADRKELARLVMSYNLLSELLPSSDSKVIFTAIKNFLLKGKIELLDWKQNEEINPNQILYNDLSKEEDKDLEFKGSWSFDIKEYVHNKDRDSKMNDIIRSEVMKWEVLKNIAAMQNTVGGKIYLGILENDDPTLTPNTREWIKNQDAVEYENKKLILGIDSELSISKRNIDQYIREIEQAVKDQIDEKSLEFVDIISFIDIADAEKVVICIQVNPRYDGGAWYKDKFFWRTGKSAVPKKNKDVRDYLNNRDSKYHKEKIKEEENQEIEDTDL